MFVSSWQKRRRLPGADKRPGDDDDGGDGGDYGGDGGVGDVETGDSLMIT